MIVWAEGFEHYGEVSHMMDGLWAQIDTVGVSLQGDAATGEKCLQVSALTTGRRYLTDDFERAGVGCHFKLAALPLNTNHSFVLLGFRDPNGAELMSVRVTPTGRIQLINGPLGFGAVVAATSKLAIAPGVWNHIEIVADTGSQDVEVRVNGKQAIAHNLASLAGDLISEVCFGMFYTGTSNLFVRTWYDDIIAQGGGDTDFKGMAGVYYLQPTSDGVPQDWELTSGALAYPLVNELNPDDDEGYIFTGDVDATATLGVEALPLNVQDVLAVIPMARVRKTDTGECDVALGVVSGGVPGEGSEVAVTAGYSYQYAVFETDPEDDAAWAPTPMPNITIRRAL